MNSINRRTAIKGAFAIGAGLHISEYVHAQDSSNDEKSELTLDQKNIMAAGFTKQETECWTFAAKTAGTFFSLPELHPADKQEIAQAIHIIQNKLLARPTYRKYIEISKANAKKKK